jgi:hypothetical protein
MNGIFRGGCPSILAQLADLLNLLLCT